MMRRPDGKYSTINTEEALMVLADDILSTGHFAIDVETTSVDQMTCKLVGISLSARPSEGYYIPLAHTDGTEQLDWETVQPYVSMLCADVSIRVIFFNAIYDMVVLERYGCSVEGTIYDTMITEHTIDNGRYYRFNMAECVERSLGYNMIPLSHLLGTGKNQITFDQVSVLAATTYAAADVDMPMRLFWERRVQDPILARRNEEIDFPLIKTLKTMMLTGIMVDLGYMREMKSSLEADVVLKQCELEELAGRQVSVFAYASLSKLLFDEMKLIPGDGFGRSKSGNYTTAGDHLARIRNQHKIVDVIILLREMQHVLNHHLNTIISRAIDHRIHTGFNLITATTRLSSSGPNLQNVVSGAVAGYEIRRGFVVRPGYSWVKIDYSQVELRVLAHMLVHLFKDWSYAQIFLDGGDVHRDTAAAILGIVSSKVDKEQRRIAKAINFGIIYGQGPGGLMYSLNSSYVEAVGFFNSYFASYPGIERWMKWQKSFGDEHGYVETPFYKTRRYVRKGEHTVMLNCLDAETEALTKRGWVKGFDLLLDDEILTKNANSGELEWQFPTDLRLWPEYRGPVVEFKSRAFHAISTSEHRWLVYNKQRKADIVSTTNTLNRYGSDRIHRTGVYVGSVDAVYPDWYVQVVGWVMTDGYYDRRSRAVLITQSKSASFDQLSDLVRVWEGPSYEYGPTEKCSFKRYRFSGEWAARMKLEMPDKNLTIPFMLSLTKRQLRLLLDAMLAGDGSFDGFKQVFYASNVIRSDMFAVLCTFNSIATTVMYRATGDVSKYCGDGYAMKNVPKSRGCYVVTLLRRDKVQVVQSQVTEHSSSEGGVWCPVVLNTFFVARRSGKVFITGNTPIQAGAAEIIRKAMNEVQEFIETSGSRARMLLQVHDELDFEVPDTELEWFIPSIVRIMIEVIDMAVPLEVEVEVGSNWGELKVIEAPYTILEDE